LIQDEHGGFLRSKWLLPLKMGPLTCIGNWTDGQSPVRKSLTHSLEQVHDWAAEVREFSVPNKCTAFPTRRLSGRLLALKPYGLGCPSLKTERKDDHATDRGFI
jgi:hypothetical protein